MIVFAIVAKDGNREYVIGEPFVWESTCDQELKDLKQMLDWQSNKLGVKSKVTLDKMPVKVNFNQPSTIRTTDNINRQVSLMRKYRGILFN